MAPDNVIPELQSDVYQVGDFETTYRSKQSWGAICSMRCQDRNKNLTRLRELGLKNAIRDTI